MSRTIPDEATSSWESAVDMMAARIEAVMIPMMRGWRWAEARKGKRFSRSPPGSSSSRM